jgi:uncharacterized protein YvpB
MVRHFGDKEKIVSTDAADKEIVELVNFEESHGYKVDVTVNELNQIAKDFYGMNSGRVVIGFSIEDIKKEIAKGHPVIIPAAGKLLENPNFKNGGPNYHMLVITGYDQANFITNDPGTRKGYGYKYDFDLLFSAIHDWNSENISNGAKSYLVFD